ncbi:MAG: FeoB-associated Cys-rich membrane protein [Pseudobutyrivibrio sp.]|nr:FeoB-associated Cys-rich membrane protein [Pseudobutyrivibrio sp.]
MNIFDIIIGLAIAVGFVLALRKTVKDKMKGNCCGTGNNCGSCKGCGAIFNNDISLQLK